jgi:hypothetical protein
MINVSADTANSSFLRARPKLAFLLCCQILACCLSLVEVAELYHQFHYVMFDMTGLYPAVLRVALFATVATIFVFARFSFGYFLGYYFYNMIVGYLWLVEFSRFNYDHTLAGVSAFVSALAFLLPALLITLPIRQRFVLSERMLDNLLSLILVLATAVIAAGSLYNFKVVGLSEIYAFRDSLEFPVLLRYAMGATSNALLPFAFACFVARRQSGRAGIVLLLLVSFYPVTLTKLTLFAPFWLLFLALLARFLEGRISTVLSLLLPTAIGLLLKFLFDAYVLRYSWPIEYFGAINFRMLAIPSLALDYYNDFFSTHDHTYFCQISFMKPFVACPYSEPLPIVMANEYRFGNLNASLFATEGIASVGLVLAPFVALGCGLVISLTNSLSFGLPSRFILLSGGLLVQVFLNVALTTTLVTNGAALLFLLWYVTPRGIFTGEDGARMATRVKGAVPARPEIAESTCPN